MFALTQSRGKTLSDNDLLKISASGLASSAVATFPQQTRTDTIRPTLCQQQIAQRTLQKELLTKNQRKSDTLGKLERISLVKTDTKY